MKLTFLKAEVPLTKSYEKKGDQYVGGSYPGVRNFTSIEETVTDVREFSQLLMKNSDLGHCLLTNSLTEQIVDSPRAKLSDKDELRKWIVLDIDGLNGISSIPEFIVKILPAPFHDVSYVVQHSPSSGIKPGVRAHLFYLLDDEVDVKSVSSWLKYQNLVTDLLSDQVTLSKSTMALSFPLDWVANNNGRIVYITPPKCIGFSDLVEDRITLSLQKHDTLSFNFSAIGSAQMRVKLREKLDDLRDKAGLKTHRKGTDIYEQRGDHEVIIEKFVEPARITGAVPDNDLFMRCNLDGGDSYAYYYHRNAPKYLHNFKGEPSIPMRELDSEFYNRVAHPDAEELRKNDIQPFVFRGYGTDKYYVGLRKGDEVTKQPAVIGAGPRIDDFFLQNNGLPPSPIPTKDRVFDPSLDTQLPADKQLFNTWRATDYLRETLERSRPPTTIERLIRHVLGGDEECYEYFINWLAGVYQNRYKTGTAWVLHGVPGTGKGLLYNNVLCPIFGYDYCAQKQIGHLQDQFNPWAEQCLILNVDETNAEDAGRDVKKIINQLKNWITEPFINVRAMGVAAVSVPSYTNFIFTTNDIGGMQIQEGDRRFNVAPRQENRLIISTDEVDAIKDELISFCQFLNQVKVDDVKVKYTLDNRAKGDMQQAGLSSIDEFFKALGEADLEYFYENKDEQSEDHFAPKEFKDAVAQWVTDMKAGVTSQVTVAQLKAAHVVMCRDRGMKSATFRAMCRKRNQPVKRLGQHTDDQDSWRGWEIDWKVSKEFKRSVKAHLSIVTPKTEEEIVKGIKRETEVASPSDQS
jgi:hypothetical protein